MARYINGQMATSALTPSVDAIVARLAEHRVLSGVPRAELEWIASHSTTRRYETGELVATSGGTPTELIVMFTGRIGVHVERGTGRRHLFEFTGGDVTGVLPYSRVTTSIGDILVEEPSDVLAMHRDLLPELIRACPVATAAMVHRMLDRARQFVATDWQDEKMASLGRLAAGMAHELNNPASATVRSATLLADALTALERASLTLGAMGLSSAQLAAIRTVRDAPLNRASGVLSSVQRLDREDEITTWLETHTADLDATSALADGGFTASQLDELARTIPASALNPALCWIAASHTARSLSSDIEHAGTRISELVLAVKRFSYMDRATVTIPTNVAQGLADTVAVLSGKARAKDVSITLDVPADLPLVPAFAAELNQVWANLVDNALDAVSQGGHVEVRAVVEGAQVVVRVVDNGPGIPADIRSRIFDPFFTTKPVGQGSGLGLDIARRIVRMHQGQIVVESRPGHTEFSVSIPLRGAAG